MSDAERIAREAHDAMWKHSHFRPDGMVERALIDAARRGIEFGRSQGCTAVEREFIEAWSEYREDSTKYMQARWIAASDALLAERKPKPKWRVENYKGEEHYAVGPDGVSRAFWKNNGHPDPETCAREVERLNAEAK